jgi:hypothetical protein
MDIFLAIPCHDGKVVAECEVSILRNTHLMRDMGHTVVPYYLPRNIYLDKARNKCVHRFLESKCTDLVFIDSDISFDDDAILKLIKHDKDIVAGIYPLKQDFEEYPMQLYYDRDNNFKDEETGLIMANMVPTGLMRIKRSVFEKMITFDNSEEKYRIQKDHDGIYTFFNTGILFENDNTWWGEDVAFCRYWKLHGGKIFIEPDITFSHIGTKKWSGNLHKYLMSRSTDFIPDGWLTNNEKNILKFLVSKSRNAVEIGSWKGKSTKVLLENCQGMVYAVDHWKGSPDDITGEIIEENIYDEFIKNVGFYPNLKILKGSSLDMVHQFNGNRADLIYIDADHSYEGCKSDIEAWLPKCSKIICGHDYTDSFPGVIKAVKEKFEKVNVIDSFWWVEL